MGCWRGEYYIPTDYEHEPQSFDCTGLTEVELWGDYYGIEDGFDYIETTKISQERFHQQYVT